MQFMINAVCHKYTTKPEVKEPVQMINEQRKLKLKIVKFKSETFRNTQ